MPGDKVPSWHHAWLYPQSHQPRKQASLPSGVLSAALLGSQDRRLPSLASSPLPLGRGAALPWFGSPTLLLCGDLGGGKQPPCAISLALSRV